MRIQNYSDNSPAAAGIPPASVADPFQIGDAPYYSALFEMRCRQELAKARDIAEFQQKILAFVNAAGFADFGFLHLQRKEEAEAYLRTFSEEFEHYYDAEGIWDHDLMLQYAAMNTDPLYQSSVERFVESATFATETIVKNRKIQKFTRAQGYFEYYNIPRPSCSGTGNVLLAISSRHMAAGELRRRVEKNKKALQILCGAIDQVGIKKFPEFFLGTSVCHKITIHARPLQLLQTLAQKNMKLADAAEEMSISISTANKQIAAAKVALNANTTASAVYRAIRAGLIEIEEEEEE